MGFVARLFGGVPREEWGGIRLADAEPWCVSRTKDVERFVRALPLLVPAESVAYFEGTAEAHVKHYLQTISVPAQIRLAIGTIWPRPDCYHVPLTPETMEALAAFIERTPTGYFCSHCHVYRNEIVLLEWHDAFTDVPMYISRTIDREIVAAFATRIGSSLSVGFP